MKKKEVGILEIVNAFSKSLAQETKKKEFGCKLTHDQITTLKNFLKTKILLPIINGENNKLDKRGKRIKERALEKIKRYKISPMRVDKNNDKTVKERALEKIKKYNDYNFHNITTIFEYFTHPDNQYLIFGIENKEELKELINEYRDELNITKDNIEDYIDELSEKLKPYIDSFESDSSSESDSESSSESDSESSSENDLEISPKSSEESKKNNSPKQEGVSSSDKTYNKNLSFDKFPAKIGPFSTQIISSVSDFSDTSTDYYSLINKNENIKFKCSPWSEINIPKKNKFFQELAIPSDSQKQRFLYPISIQKQISVEDSLLDKLIKNGGFQYINNQSRLTTTVLDNSSTLSSKERNIYFGNGLPLQIDTNMNDTLRINSVPVTLKSLQKKGVNFFSWIPPNTVLNNSVTSTYGGFYYLYNEDKIPDARDIYFPIKLNNKSVVNVDVYKALNKKKCVQFGSNRKECEKAYDRCINNKVYNIGMERCCNATKNKKYLYYDEGICDINL